MKCCEKETKIWIFGVLGVCFFLAGIANLIPFDTGMILAIIFWIVAGLFSICKKTPEKPIKKKK